MYIENMSRIKITLLELVLLKKLKEKANNGRVISYSELLKDEEIRRLILPNYWLALSEIKSALKRLRDLGLINAKLSPKIYVFTVRNYRVIKVSKVDAEIEVK